jgi:uncharacterized protein (TIGR03086 family)
MWQPVDRKEAPMPLDMTSATDRLAELIRAVPDEALGNPTPCDMPLGALLDHVETFSGAFAAAARRDFSTFGGPAPVPDAARLGPDWRDRIPRAVADLAEAWNEPGAWTGMTKAGGFEMPGEVAGTIALDEVVIHGWDVARSSGQPYDVEPDLLAAVHGFVAPLAGPNPPIAREGIFGAPVPVPDDAPLIDRVLGLTGRHPAWSPTTPPA